MCAKKNGKKDWHEQSHIRTAIWLAIMVVTAAAFYEFSKLGTKFMNEKKGVQQAAKAPAATQAAAAAPSSTATSGNP